LNLWQGRSTLAWKKCEEKFGKRREKLKSRENVQKRSKGVNKKCEGTVF